MATSSIARPRPTSILLQSYPPLPLTSSTSSISSQTSRKKDLVLDAKHIRFAPLPEPDRDILTELSNPSADVCDPDPPQLIEHILSSSNSSSSSSQLSSSTTLTTQCDTSPNSSVGSSPIIQSSTLPSKYPSTNLAAISPNPNSPTIDIAINPGPDSSSSSEPLRWVKKPHIFLLRPFKRSSASSSASSSHTLTPTPSIENRKKRAISTEEILTLGAVNLFRPPSRESTRSARSSRDNDSSWGLDLSRWPSLGGSHSNISTGSPLARSQSAQSCRSKSSSSLLPSFPSSSSSSLSSDSKIKARANSTPPVQQSNRRKGTRMLNGRVYGGPKKNANPFANARDEEPEFVEWGYGGMGSVKGARSAGVSSNWERLHGGSAMASGAKTRLDVGVGGVGAGIGATDADLDDGSGLAWVKRRKEERERKAREQKEKEEKEAEKENSESQTNTPIPTRSSTLESIPILSSSDIEPVTHIPSTIDVSPLTIVLKEDGETVTKAGFSTPIPSRYPSELGVASYFQNPMTDEPVNADLSKPEESQPHTHENERVLQAVTIPVRSPRHHHHRQPSKAGSREVVLSPSTEGSAALQHVGPPIVPPSPNVDAGDTMVASPGLLNTSTITSIESDKATSPTSFSSFEESGSESEEADDGDDEDEDEDEEELQTQNERMKTTLGTAAGVEKISRHKE